MTHPQPDVTPDQLAAALLGEVSAYTIRRFCRAGRLKGARLVGRSWQIPYDTAAAFVQTYERHRPDSIGNPSGGEQ